LILFTSERINADTKTEHSGRLTVGPQLEESMRFKKTVLIIAALLVVLPLAVSTGFACDKKNAETASVMADGAQKDCCKKKAAELASLEKAAAGGCDKSKATLAAMKAEAGEEGCSKTKAAKMASLEKAAAGGCDKSKAALAVMQAENAEGADKAVVAEGASD
jgi:hypothetical protein